MDTAGTVGARACSRRLAPHSAASRARPTAAATAAPPPTNAPPPSPFYPPELPCPALHKSSKTCSMSSSMCTAAVLRRALPLSRPGGFHSRRAITRALSTDSFFISRNSKSQPVQVSRSFISQSRERVLSGIQPTGVPHIGAHPSASHLPTYKPPCASCYPEL
jgi:hypothetical protein